MALMAQQGAEVKVLLKNGFLNLIEAPSVGEDRGEVTPLESRGKKKPKTTPAAIPSPSGGTGNVEHPVVAPWDCALPERRHLSLEAPFAGNEDLQSPVGSAGSASIQTGKQWLHWRAGGLSSHLSNLHMAFQ